MILEGVCTTRNADGTVNIAPMGPVVDESLTSFQLRPFQTSQTFTNLQRTGCCVFHVTDDVEVIARAITGNWAEAPALIAAARVDGDVLTGACRWFELEVTEIDTSHERSLIQTRIVHTGWLRDFWGFNRAKHAVIETAIAATRLHLLPPEQLQLQLREWEIIVTKTAGPQERIAFDLLTSYIRSRAEISHPPCGE